MPYPGDPTIRSQILSNIQSTLATIATPAYKTSVATVREWNGSVFEVNSYPCVIVVPQGESHNDGRIGIVEHTMDILLVLGVYDQAWKTRIQDLIADVRVALTTDWTRGGVALTTQILDDEVFEADPSNPISEAQMSVRVLYRTLYNNPSQHY